MSYISGKDCMGSIGMPNGNDYDEHIGFLEDWLKDQNEGRYHQNSVYFFGLIDEELKPNPERRLCVCASSTTWSRPKVRTVGIYICTSLDDSNKWVVIGYVIVEDERITNMNYEDLKWKDVYQPRNANDFPDAQFMVF